jgi:AraC family transcriptional activator of pobA
MQKIPVRHITTDLRDENNIGRFSIRKIQQLTKEKNLVHDLHRHDFFFILAVQTGKGIHEVDFIPYEVTDYSVFILRPGQVHRLEMAAGCTGYLITFDSAFYKPRDTGSSQRLTKAASKNYCAFDVDGFSKLNTILGSIFDEFDTKKEGFGYAIIANLDLFFIEYGRQSRNPESSIKTKGNYSQDQFQELVHLLEKNIGNMKNVSQYAELLNLSSYQLNSITKSAVAKTVSELINEQIILEARRILLATTNQVKEVADHLGYEDVSYFIRFFKKQTGLTPDAFRKNFK